MPENRDQGIWLNGTVKKNEIVAVFIQILLDKSDDDNHLVLMLRGELDKYRKGPGTMPRPEGEGTSDADAQRRVADLSSRMSQQQVNSLHRRFIYKGTSTHAQGTDPRVA